MPDPSGLGRVVRDGSGAVHRIVEDRDASPSERAIDEIYTGVLAAPTALLSAWVARLTPHNAQNEYYLTPVVARSGGDRAAAVAGGGPREPAEGATNNSECVLIEGPCNQDVHCALHVPWSQARAVLCAQLAASPVSQLELSPARV